MQNERRKWRKSVALLVALVGLVRRGELPASLYLKLQITNEWR